MVGKAVAPADKCIGRPHGPVITRAEDPIEARAFAVLDNVGEALVTLSSFTGTLEQILELGNLVRRRVSAAIILSSASHWSKDQEESTPA